MQQYLLCNTMHSTVVAVVQCLAVCHIHVMCQNG